MPVLPEIGGTLGYSSTHPIRTARSGEGEEYAGGVIVAFVGAGSDAELEGVARYRRARSICQMHGSG